MLELKRIIGKFKLGETYDYEDKEDFICKLNKITKNYGEYQENCTTAFQDFLNWDNEEKN